MNIAVIENHDLALSFWRKNQVKNYMLIHFDAHFDYTDPHEIFYVTISNFIGSALIEGIANEIIWVVPTPFFKSEKTIKKIISMLGKDFIHLNITEMGIQAISSSLSYIKLTVTTLEYMEHYIVSNTDKLLLDIDVDFFCNPIGSRPYSCTNVKSLWISIKEFYTHIAPILSKKILVSISKSIAGGFTPVIYSYLIEELKDCLTGSYDSDVFYESAFNGINCLIKGQYNNSYRYFNKCIQCSSTRLTGISGLIYAGCCLGNYNKAFQYYDTFLHEYSEYTAYIYPVYSCIQSQEYKKAKLMLQKWLLINEKDHHANLYMIKILLAEQCGELESFARYFKYLDDEISQFECSYLHAQIDFRTGFYFSSIENCLRVEMYLKRNDTPMWAAHLSSFEKRKNNLYILISIYELLSYNYQMTDDDRKARKYATLCIRLGYRNEKLQDIYMSK